MRHYQLVTGAALLAVVLAGRSSEGQPHKRMAAPANAELAKLLELAKSQREDTQMVLIESADDLGSSLYSNLPRVLSGEAKTKTILVQVQPNEHFVSGKTSPQVSGKLVINGHEIRMKKLADGVLFGAGYAPTREALDSLDYRITCETRDASGKRGHYIDIDAKPRK